MSDESTARPRPRSRFGSVLDHLVHLPSYTDSCFEPVSSQAPAVEVLPRPKSARPRAPVW